MKCYTSSNLFNDLQKLVDKDVVRYASDFELDKDLINKHFMIDGKHDFIWFTRESGTHCGVESQAYLNGSMFNAECKCFLRCSDAKAYYIHVERAVNERLEGSVYPVDHTELWEDIAQNSVDVRTVQLTVYEQFQKDETIEVPYSEHRHAAEMIARRQQEKYGPYPEGCGVTQVYKPSEADSGKLTAHLRTVANERALAKAYPFNELLGEKPPEKRDIASMSEMGLDAALDKESGKALPLSDTVSR